MGQSLHKRWPVYWATGCHAQLYLPGAHQDFDQLVRVRLKRPRSENAVPSLKQIVTMKLKFERILVNPGQVLTQILTFNIQWDTQTEKAFGRKGSTSRTRRTRRTRKALAAREQWCTSSASASASECKCSYSASRSKWLHHLLGHRTNHNFRHWSWIIDGVSIILSRQQFH